MAIRIRFDASGNPEEPTVVLAKKNGDKLGRIEARSIEVVDYLNDAPEMSFKVYKNLDGKECDLWDEITDFKLVYCVEWNMWFEATVELNESAESVKTVFCTSLGHSELSQIMLYDIEINTEDDIAREEYTKPTVLYDKDNPSSSLLHRIMEKAPHYYVEHVDHTIKSIQRTFSFDDKSLYDAFREIAEEINCLFCTNVYSDGDGNMQRAISVYDLESNCAACRHRGEFVGVCPECGSDDVIEGYGNDTTIFVAADDLAGNIELTTDVDSVKNCFKLEAGDDLMTATIRNCNPNGSDYIWYFSADMKKDMPKELVDKIKSYDERYRYYQKEHVILQDANTAVIEYNKLVDKYLHMNEKLGKIKVPIIGYPSLMNAYYSAIDMELFLRSSMMPNIKVADTDAKKEAAKLTRDNLSPVAVKSIDSISKTTADSVVLSMAKVVVDSRFRVKIKNSSFTKTASSCVWKGDFEVTNYSDENDVASSQLVSVTINDNYEIFVKQKIDKILNSGDKERLDIVGLFKKPLPEFVAEIKRYGLNRLVSFSDACQSCIDILIEQGIADKKTWSGGEKNLYDDLYVPYLEKMTAISEEIKVRESEIRIVAGEYDSDGDILYYGVQIYLEEQRDIIQENLDFESHLGEELWKVFCSFRREDKFSNDNYISDGLNNAELFDNAREFIKTAENEIFKSAEMQHSISTELKNLLVIDKFSPIVDDFQVGNWIRVMVDGDVFKLRLIEYSVDYDDIESISVEFSDVTKSKNSVSDIESILEQSSSMATSYDSVKRQAKKGNAGNNRLDGWVEDGLAMTNMKIVSNADNQNITWDSHGILCREYLPVTNGYDDRQLKIINRGLYVTDDNWRTSRAGIGNFRFWNPKTEKVEEGYGVIADTLVGSLILSEQVGIYNEKNSFTLDENGMIITADVENGKTDTVFEIRKRTKSEENGDRIDRLMYVDTDGTLVVNGRIVVNNLTGQNDMTLDEIADPDRYMLQINGAVEDMGVKLETKFDVAIGNVKSEISEKYTSKTEMGELDQSLKSLINQTATQIKTEVNSRTDTLITGAVNESKSYTDQTAEAIKLSVEKNIIDKVSNTYATKSELKIASDSITSTVEQNVTNSIGKTYATKTELTQTANGLSIDISSAQSSANSAYNKASSNSNFLSTHFSFTSAGLIVQSSSSSFKTRVSSSSFDILDASSNKVLTAGTNGKYAYIKANGTASNTLQLRGSNNSWGVVNIGENSVDINGASVEFALTRSGDGINRVYYARKQLYYNSSGSSGTISLNKSANYFDKIIIYYKDSESDMSSTEVHNYRSSCYANLFTNYGNANGWYSETRLVSISGSTISTYSDWYARSFINPSGTVYFNNGGASGFIKIIAVYGIRF